MPGSFDPLRIVCFGMGAIGTYIGGSLAAAGCELVFIEKNQPPSGGQGIALKINTPQGLKTVQNVKTFTTVEDALTDRQIDVALLAVKAFDTPALVTQLAEFRNKIPPILCLQNGVENEPIIESILGLGSVIGASITTAVRRNAPGDVQVEKLRGVAIEGGTPLSARLIYWFNRAGLKARGYTDRDSMKWSKLLTNLQVNATSAILNWTPSQVLRNPLAYKIEVMQLKEALAVMQKMHLKVIDLPGTPTRMLVYALASLPLSLGRSLVGIPLSKARGGKMPSLQMDLQAGREQSEVEFLNGAVVRFGEKVGVKTPVNRALTEILVALASGGVAKGMYDGKPEVLMKKIEEFS